MRYPPRPSPPPLDVDAIRVIVWGTALWFVGFLALLPFLGRLQDAGAADWFWTALAGWVLGLLGLAVATAQLRRR